jgi:hypothetical protein
MVMTGRTSRSIFLLPFVSIKGCRVAAPVELSVGIMRIVYLLIFSLLSCLVASRDAGILYEVWHTRAAQAMARVKAEGGMQLTTELVIESAGAHSLDDVYGPYNVTATEFPSVFSSPGFTARGFTASSHALNADIWNAQPALGFYCLYRARPGQVPAAPDCNNTAGVAAAHAAMLTDAGAALSHSRNHFFISI